MEAENRYQRRSRIVHVLNVPLGYALDLHSLRPCWMTLLSLLSLSGLYQAQMLKIFRMLKMAFSCVLGSPKSSTYPRGYASGFVLPAALLRGHFKFPPQTFIRSVQMLKYFSMLMYRSPVSHRMVTTFLPGPNSSATFCAAKTLAPAEMPTRSPSFFASNFAV